ncbi:MAG: RnfABCDGE type electron transport complex subunit B [Sphaerochaetaceae bacterium]|jgi:Na+-translocating ferredoxin:NAD+ oxidoreductase RNF subunit RnfB|nr:RnfABCDGE type electron transport complex subunit B [Sphaerochaetaceae bacterium]MDY0372414.1 RnfABCDGE type electron transport complex subunit B [Sphaerochaetaceae bacterium]
MNILFAFLIIASLGLLLGLGLAVAAKKLAVKKDERAEEILAVLPGANCGACGYPGCAGYASALSKGEAENGLCSPGGAETSAAVAEILGIEASAVHERMVAFVHCRGNNELTQRDYHYQGIEECSGAYMLFQGDSSCKYGCLHLGSCMRVCPTNAISRDALGNMRVDPDACIGCLKCTLVCPTKVIRMIPARGSHAIACNSLDKGGVVRKICSVGCIGCKICEKKFPDSGCTVTNFLSEIDYESPMTQIGEAAQACPTSCIVEAR